MERRTWYPAFRKGSLLALLVLAVGSAVWGQGYTIDRVRNRVVVDTQDHWSYWTFPKGILELTEDGKARPVFVRKNINASLNAGDFVHGADIRGGISGGGSNLGDGPNLIDGDPNTYWEPDTAAPLRDWWVEIDLGRAVSAKKIVLKFVEEGLGDPFRQFRVLTSDGDVAFEGTKMMDLKVVGKTRKSNKDQRLFEYTLVPSATADWDGDGQPDVEGDAIQYVRVVITDSHFGKAEEMSREDYEALSPEDRGDREYFRKLPAGGEKVISEEGYLDLDPERQGTIRYYRREHPRLAEVEVWSIGDNIGLGLVERGGSATSTGTASGAFDGSIIDAGTIFVFNPIRQTGDLFVDLGALFWIDLVRMVNNPRPVWLMDPVRGYMLRGSDGSKASDGSYIWETLSPRFREDNPRQIRVFEDHFSIRKIRYLDIRNVDLSIDWSQMGVGYSVSAIYELQIFGEGYVPEVEMISPLIELGGLRNITSIEWDAEMPPGTSVELQTRTGNELREIQRFFDKMGQEITEKRYNQLPKSFRGEVTTEYSPGADWSSWTPPYIHSGAAIASPNPRKYLLLRARLVSDDPHTFPTLDRIEVNFVAPVAKELVGEISPSQIERAGVPHDFSLYLKPTFAPSDPGFDRLLIYSPSGVEMELLGLHVGSEEDFMEGREKTLSSDEFERAPTARDSMLIDLTKPVRPGGPGLLSTDFRTTIFLNGTTFEALLATSSVKDSWQRVDPGDATVSATGEHMIVDIPIVNRILGDTRLHPNPFTPNGDGLNEEIIFEFSVFKVNTERPVKVTIYDLGGRKIRELSESRTRASGRYSIRWSGADAEGSTVPPGIYLGRITVEVDAETAENETITRPVYVVY